MNAITRSFTGRKRIRKSFGRIPEVAPMPNLIDVQRASYEAFLQMNVQPDSRHADRAAGSVQVRLPDRRLRRPRPAGVRLLRAGGAEIRRRGVHPARHDLRRAAEGDPAPDRLGRGRGHRRALDPRHQGTARLHGRHAADDRQRHVHHQRHRARHRHRRCTARPGVFFDHDKGKTHSSRQVSVRRARDPVSRLLARLRVRQQGPGLRPHRPQAEAAGHHAALCAGERGHASSCARSARRRARRSRSARSAAWTPRRS